MDILLIRASVSSDGSFLLRSALIYSDRLTFADPARGLGTAPGPILPPEQHKVMAGYASAPPPMSYRQALFPISLVSCQRLDLHRPSLLQSSHTHDE